MVRQTPRAFVERLDFLTSLGRPYGRRGGVGVTYVVTDLGVLEPDAESGELTMTALYPDVTPEGTREATGWKLRLADELRAVQPRPWRARGSSGAQAGERGNCRAMSRAIAEPFETVADGQDAGQPPYLYPDYRSTELRAPKRPLVILPHTCPSSPGRRTATSRSASSTTTSRASTTASRSENASTSADG